MNYLFIAASKCEVLQCTINYIFFPLQKQKRKFCSLNIKDRILITTEDNDYTGRWGELKNALGQGEFNLIDVDSPGVFNDIYSMMDRVYNISPFHDKHPVRYLVGCSTSSRDIPRKERVITREQCKRIASQYNFKYFELNLNEFNNDNVKNMVESMRSDL